MSCCQECADKGPDVTCAPCGQPQPQGLTYSAGWQRRGIGNPNDAMALAAAGAAPVFATPAEQVAYDQGVGDGRWGAVPWSLALGGFLVAGIITVVLAANRGKVIL